MSKGNRRPGKVSWQQGTVSHPALPTLCIRGGGENILIESSTVLNSEKDFSKLDQIDREYHHLLGGPTDRPSWDGRPCHRTFL